MDAVEALAAAAGIELSTGSGPDWETVERSLEGLTLPSDYKRLVNGFPHGRFKELVMVIRPGIQGGSLNDYLAQSLAVFLADRGRRSGCLDGGLGGQGLREVARLSGNHVGVPAQDHQRLTC